MLFAGLTKQLADLFKVRAGEERTVSLVLAMTFLVAAGGTVGGNAIEALFFSRQGTSALPALYMALGVSNFIASLAITAVLGRVARVRVYLALPLVLATSLALQRVVLAFDIPWTYAVFWLLMNVEGLLQGMLAWGRAAGLPLRRTARGVLRPLRWRVDRRGVPRVALRREPALRARRHHGRDPRLPVAVRGRLCLAARHAHGVRRSRRLPFRTAPIPPRHREPGLRVGLQRDPAGTPRSGPRVRERRARSGRHRDRRRRAADRRPRARHEPARRHRARRGAGHRLHLVARVAPVHGRARANASDRAADRLHRRGGALRRLPTRRRRRVGGPRRRGGCRSTNTTHRGRGAGSARRPGRSARRRAR